MSAEQTVYAWLAAYAPLTALLGGSASPRIYPDVVPQDKDLPALAYARALSEPVATLHGQVVAEFVTVQAQYWAKTRAEAEQGGNEIVAALHANKEPYTARAVLWDDETGYFGCAVDVRLLINL